MTPDDIDIFRHIPTLQTERLILRKIRVQDSRDMYEYSRLEEVTRYLLWSPHTDEKYTRRYISRLQSEYRHGYFYDWGIEYKESGKFIGTVGFTMFDIENNCTEIGYVLNPLYKNLGLATEAVKCIMQFGYTTLSLHRIEARYIIGNDASRRVMEKCGMTFEGIQYGKMLIKGHYRDIGICARVY